MEPAAPARVCSKPGRGQVGSVIVEFALVLPILLLVVLGITEFGRALMSTNALYSASREGARVAALGGPGGVPNISAVNTRVHEVLNAASIQLVNRTINVTLDAATRRVTVRVQADLPLLSGQVLPIQGTMRLGGTTVTRWEP